MTRTVSSRLDLKVYDDVDLIFSVAVAQGLASAESLTVTANGASVEPQEVIGRHRTRLHCLTAHPGPLTVTYAATIDDVTDRPEASDADLIEYRRPSRYCESDVLFALARAQFSGLTGHRLLAEVGDWVRQSLSYVPGASQVTDGAVNTFLSRRGVCRDYAHLVVALLRALDVPARLASVYAPGLSPMDFHAVAEAFVEGAWHVIDATGLASRHTLVRIATGRDAADTAFMTQHGGAVDLLTMQVDASTDQPVADDHHALVALM